MNSEQQADITNGAMRFIDEQIKKQGGNLEDFTFICEMIAAGSIVTSLKNLPHAGNSAIENFLHNVRAHVSIILNNRAN